MEDAYEIELPPGTGLDFYKEVLDNLSEDYEPVGRAFGKAVSVKEGLWDENKDRRKFDVFDYLMGVPAVSFAAGAAALAGASENLKEVLSNESTYSQRVRSSGEGLDQLVEYHQGGKIQISSISDKAWTQPDEDLIVDVENAIDEVYQREF